jgi:hypothetical protein
MTVVNDFFHGFAVQSHSVYTGLKEQTTRISPTRLPNYQLAISRYLKFIHSSTTS